MFRLAGKQIPPTVIVKVHHLSMLLQAEKMDQRVLGKHIVEYEAQHGVEDQVQDRVEDAVHQYMEHQQHLIQIVPFQKLQEPGKEVRNHKVFYINIEKYLVPQSHLMITPLH